MDETDVRALEDGLVALGVATPPGAVAGIVQHLGMVSEWNERVNLTAVRLPREMVLKHAVDSASLLSVVQIGPGSAVADVGTGAGFPGITVKCLVPRANVVLIDSLAKRCRFLEAVGAEVVSQLPGVGGCFEVVWSRAEDVGLKAGYREQFDVVVARAVAELRVLAELCLPLCRVGGEFVAMKGPAVEAEVDRAANALTVLGGRVEEVKVVELPEGAGGRTLVRIRKTRPTPNGYPRKAGTPERQPL